MNPPGRDHATAPRDDLDELARFVGECRRRRDEAARRLAPLANGRRDPLRDAPSDGAS